VEVTAQEWAKASAPEWAQEWAEVSVPEWAQALVARESVAASAAAVLGAPWVVASALASLLAWSRWRGRFRKPR